MFFKTVVIIVRFLFRILNGKTEIQNKEYIPKDTVFIIAAPHRSLLDPIFISFGVYPHVFSSMAKKELFKGKFTNWLLTHLNAFPVNRENPGPSALKQPVSILKEGKTSLLIFPTGSRHSAEIKGGTSSIAKLANVPILPVVYQGPLTFKDLLKRKKATVRFGQPIYLPKEKRISRDELAAYDELLGTTFRQLDQEIDPNFVYVAK
ncbi:lysophospholipid acyltransferase family protein [Trichococcus shcherbakoviae]|jgi:1-acyl-sn-glycerol-3-phosphate acyltransferase|uniref:Phospholipid/glycerol acyltransferase n=2 Tax=Trichococcus shcherbakoviae TaxID=2094020 RepID=A0A383TGH4_9LACT|nr:1-acyl-sn-glycerol-3-phosphate acyltransferase [Trichococcus shcherbakoviae]OUL09378.1 1-acyl-sn-glycerol-3-phosphate acyltransferase [Sedimentibacter sp. SX930]TNV68975.1 1-acyl-sn-glycerol-3-phosphate acyltransferase [Trichococcus shcherbakoviae subsp. psychrophilus]SYZ79460.1 phospholipid/glycerol acyltransferase [Trichococcus shcherbakoviae]